MDTKLILGVILKKSFSHENMIKVQKNATIAVLSCALEAPRLKRQYEFAIHNSTEYQDLHEFQYQHYKKIVSKLKECGVNIVICQWGIDGVINHMLMTNGINVVTWVGGDELERVALATGAIICRRVEELEPKMLGFCGKISEVRLENSTGELIIIEECKNPRVVTFLVRGGNKMACEEAITSINDSIQIVYNCLLDSRLIIGGGALELQLYSQILELSNSILGPMSYVVRAWAEALLVIPSTLIENAGFPVLEAMTKMLDIHSKKENYMYGVGMNGPCDMLKENVWELSKLKLSILNLATETTCMIVKIDECLSIPQSKIK
eukprot:TRINITY_DN5265_c0_g1_i1.p1 TRINITY_DN5265_c0_g1~~TRINITY_DN5265_c0_g1_i1.p1  ORF type:complete len:322 (+),score=51.30 TRINITY_DN5265_c0_g1_i1:714-1679(+)